MRITEVQTDNRLVLLETRARIDHPEDLVLDEGSAGAIRSLNAMVSLAKKPHQVTIKFDGSPALIFGWDDQGFVLTDKSGFGAKGYDGMARSAASVESMLRGDTGRRVKVSTSEEKQARYKYAKSIANLYDTLKSMVPRSFKGFLQGDLMWKSTPKIVGGDYVFSPVKILYRIPVDSDMGKRIGSSKMGLVIHSFISSKDDPSPRPINDPSSIGLVDVPDIVVLPHSLSITGSLKVPEQAIDKFAAAVRKYATAIDSFMTGPIKSLPSLMKSYVNHLAGRGIVDYADAATGFLQWIDSPDSKTTPIMKENIRSYIATNQIGYKAVWVIMEGLKEMKLRLKSQLDAKANSIVSAEFGPKSHPDLHGKNGHEGFVADTEHGTIKLVNRGHFMRKPGDQSLTEYASGGASSAGGIASLSSPIGSVISRTPSLFGYVAPTPVKKRKQSTKRKKTAKHRRSKHH